MDVPANRISPILKCRVGRVPGLGLTITERIPSDKDYPSINDEAIFNVLEKVEKDFPNIETSLIEKEIDGTKYQVVVAVWTPPKASDCFLLKWYEVPPQKKTAPLWIVTTCALTALIILGVFAGLWGQQNGYIITRTITPHEPPTEANIEYKTFVETEVSELMVALDEYDTVDEFSNKLYVEQPKGWPKEFETTNEFREILEKQPFFSPLIEKLRNTKKAYNEL